MSDHMKRSIRIFTEIQNSPAKKNARPRELETI